MVGMTIDDFSLSLVPVLYSPPVVCGLSVICPKAWAVWGYTTVGQYR
jgi:hypothetical protein